MSTIGLIVGLMIFYIGVVSLAIKLMEFHNRDTFPRWFTGGLLFGDIVVGIAGTIFAMWMAL